MKKILVLLLFMFLLVPCLRERDSDMATKFSHIFYSDMNAIQTAGEGWTEEMNLVSVTYTISSNDHSSSLSFTVSNPENVTELNYITYQRILMEDREHDVPLFIGRVENVTLNEEERTFTVFCRDYSLELAERHPNPDEARHAAFYMLGQRRDQLIVGLIADYRYSGVAPISISIPGDPGIPPWGQTGDAGVTKDYRKSGLTVLQCIAELADEAPWLAGGRGFEFFVFPSGSRAAGIGQQALLYQRGLPAGLTAEWGAPDVWTATTKPLLSYSRNRKAEDVLTRVRVQGMGDVSGVIVETLGTEGAWGGVGKQIIKEAYINDPSLQTPADLLARGNSYLYYNEPGLGGENTIQLKIPGLPYANPGAWTYYAPGDYIHVHYSPLAINANYMIKKTVYVEPECISTIYVERLSKRDPVSYMEQATKRSLIGESEHKQYYDTGWVLTTGALGTVVTHNFGAIPRKVRVYGATSAVGANMALAAGYHMQGAVFYGHAITSITATTVVVDMHLAGFALSVTLPGWILNNGINFYRVIVEP